MTVLAVRPDPTRDPLDAALFTWVAAEAGLWLHGIGGKTSSMGPSASSWLVARPDPQAPVQVHRRDPARQPCGPLRPVPKRAPSRPHRRAARDRDRPGQLAEPRRACPYPSGRNPGTDPGGEAKLASALGQDYSNYAARSGRLIRHLWSPRRSLSGFHEVYPCPYAVINSLDPMYASPRKRHPPPGWSSPRRVDEPACRCRLRG